MTGKMAAKILKGEANITEMPVQYAQFQRVYNPELCTELGIVVPAGYNTVS
jgi:putative ABC transport system substrate-binding protein